MKKKLVLTVLSVALVAALAVGGTLAYLTAKTTAVKNTFTIGNIGMNLTEPNWVADSKITPGAVIAKDPTVTITQGSEACYVYVAVKNDMVISDTTVANFDLNTGWEEVAGVTAANVTLYKYTTEIADTNMASADYQIPTSLFSNVNFNDTIDETNIGSLADETISVAAYAHQSSAGTGTADAAAVAWANDATTFA